MKQKLRQFTGGKLRGICCLALAAVLAAGAAFNGAAATNSSVRYDVKIVSSYTHTAVLSGGDVYFMGTNGASQFPDCDESYSASPLHLASGAVDVAVSDDRTLIVYDTGRLEQYGTDPSDDVRSVRFGVGIADDVRQVAASDTFAAYVTSGGEVYTWGLNSFGQLGVGNTETSREPVKVTLPGVVKKISLGSTFAVALLADGSVYGWGSDSLCELGYTGDGLVDGCLLEPAFITDNAVDIDTGSRHTCILKKNGALYTCGDNTYSQTGAGSDVLFSGITQVLTGVKSVSAGDKHNLAVTADGSVYAWGFGISGQLGTGDTLRISEPTLTDFDYVQVFACYNNSFGIKEDGSIYSFGDNTNYRLGNADGSESLTPMLILDKEMNWVYTEEQDDDTLCDDPEDDTTPGHSVATPDVSPDAEGETGMPEIVSTPFISGDGNGTFRPGDEVNRSEFLRMLVSALCGDFDKTADYGSCSYSDVPVGAWYEKYIAYAELHEIVSGYSDGTVRPDDTITRGEAAQFISKALGSVSPQTDSAADFTDVGGHWAENKIKALASAGIINGYDDQTFRPENTITRSEAVTMIARAAGFNPSTAEKQTISEQFETPFTDVSDGDWYYPYIIRAVGYVKSSSAE